MAYGNMNPGLLLVRCLDRTTFSPISGARAILTWVQAASEIGGRLTLYNTKGEKDTAPSADADSSGVAFLQFMWDPLELPQLLDAWSFIRLSAIGPALQFGGVFSSTQQNKPYFSTRVGNERIYQCINLGQVWSGGSGDFQFKSGEKNAMDAMSKIKEILTFRAKIAKDKVPNLPFLKVMRPEMEMVSLLGGFDVYMDPQST